MLKLKEIKNNKTVVITVFTLLMLSVVAVMVIQFFNKNYNDVFLCLLTLVMFFVPRFIEKNMQLELPNGLQITMLLFVYSAEILGEIRGFYLSFPYWDTMLHTINGFLMAAIGFSLIDLLNTTERIHFKLSPLFVALVAFCFSMTIGVMWEFFEFGMDQITLTDMQKDAKYETVSTVSIHPEGKNIPVIIEDVEKTVITGKIHNEKQEIIITDGYLDVGLYDTMIDLLVNFIGAFVFSIYGLLYIKNRGKGSEFLRHFIIKKKKESSD